MGRFTFQKPTDQPSGRYRLLDELRDSLRSGGFDELRVVVAFARLGALLRLEPDFEAFLGNGGQVKAVFGVDEGGTSVEALEFGRSHFEEMYIAHTPGAFTPTFHPKLYLFSGVEGALAYLGSNNLTVGGLETNFESHTRIELARSGDEEMLGELMSLWEDAKGVSAEVTDELMEHLVRAGTIRTEKALRSARKGEWSKGEPGVGRESKGFFPGLEIKPPSPLPASRPRGVRASAVTPTSIPAEVAEALLIEIIPHHNGEILLSKTAVDQNPGFFGWPFTGQTVPKYAGNEPYAERTPDPVVDIRVWDSSGKLLTSVSAHNLNTVYYERKHEVRITVPASLIKDLPARCLLVIRPGGSEGRDYELDVYTEGSEEYKELYKQCNQSMPSGGLAKARRFGWL